MLISRSLVIGVVLLASATVIADDTFKVPDGVTEVLNRCCIDCHDKESAEGNVRFDVWSNLGKANRRELLNKVQEQLYFGLMPPEDAEQTDDAERKLLLGWLDDALKNFGASKLEEKLRKPQFGNYVDHDKLFSGEYAHLKGFTRDRRWLISEFVFDAKVNQLINHPSVRTIDGVKQNVIGDNGVNIGTRFGGHSLRQSITNPFLLPTNIGVRYYDTTALTGGHLLTMISNAKKIAAYMSSEQAMKAYYPAMYRIMKMELVHRETLRNREQFLNDHIERITKDIYKDEHESLLPKFIRMQVEEVPEYTDAKGNPRKRDNVGLLDRYEQQDMRAIYLGIGIYKQDGVTHEQIIEKCERDWFTYGIHEKRIRTRVRIMKVLAKQWDMSLINEDIRKKNIQPIRYAPLSDTEMEVIHAAILKHRRNGDRYTQIIEKVHARMGEVVQGQSASRRARRMSSKISELVNELFAKIYQRPPVEEELRDNITLTKSYMETLSNQDAIAKLIETLLLSSELVYRSEFGQGPTDPHGPADDVAS